MSSVKQKLKESTLIYKSFGNFRVLKNRFRDLFLNQPKELKMLKNKYYGNSCFVVATGPSLTLDDLNLIKGFYSFSCNSILSCFDKTSWRPDFYCISDKEIFSLYSNLVNESGLQNIFLPTDLKERFSVGHTGFNRSYSQHIKGIYYKTFKNIVFPSKRPDKFFNDATSVTFFCIQIAVYLGFTSIYLLGQDCNYSTASLHSDVAKSKYTGMVNKNAGNGMIECFDNYHSFYRKKGIKIINCTRGGMLEVFPRKSLEEVIEKLKDKNKNG